MSRKDMERPIRISGGVKALAGAPANPNAKYTLVVAKPRADMLRKRQSWCKLAAAHERSYGRRRNNSASECHHSGTTAF